ncbi:MAG: hypothetical protein IPK69_02055 [Phycisphaerales bacterium]|nr:MAG: hypothetical protein IPK69_02055 [Phycisphaerales bacterium]
MRTLSLNGVVALAAGSCMSLSALGQAVPCATATLVSQGSFTGTSAGGSTEGGGSCGSSSVATWFKVQPTEDRQLIASTCGGASWDTSITIYDACPSAGGSVVGCNDDSCGLQSEARATVTAGNTYYIRMGGYGGSSGAFTLNISFAEPPPPPTDGPDVYVGDLNGIQYFATSGSLRAYSIGTTSCNLGNAPVAWYANDNRHPVIAQNLYRIKDGKFMQIGQSWLKHGFASVNGNYCGSCIDPPDGGAQLGIACSDPYGTGLNGDQGLLGPRSHVNATTGQYPYPFTSPGAGYIVPPVAASGIGRRLQVAMADVDPAQNVGAQYIGEAHYVTRDDAQWDNGRNNVSYRLVNMASATTPAFAGPTVQQQVAMRAWAAADPSVTIVEADYDAGAGLMARFVVGSKVTDNGDGTWTYVYAVHNVNSDRSAASFVVPKSGATISATGFHDVFSHSGEPYDNTDWAFSESPNEIRWSCGATSDQNANANALRWGTCYTYWFTATEGPSNGDASIVFFKPGNGGNALNVSVPVPGGTPACVADVDDGSGTGASDGAVTIDDLLYYISLFQGGVAAADVDDGTGTGTTDGAVTIDDLLYFIVRFQGGC